MARWQAKILVALLVAAPALVLRLAGAEPAPIVSLLVFGGAIVASAFILAWAAEAAQVDISAGLAIALLALIAVLPEYAVDLYFAYTSGSNPAYAQYAAANMTGSNRLLLGLGWPVVVFVFAWGLRRRGEPPQPLTLRPERRVELRFLAIAGVYAFSIPLTHKLTLLDSVVLLSLFAFYLRTVSRQERTEPELVGVAASIGGLPRRPRRILVVALFLAAAAFIVSAAEPFANALVNSGKELGLDEFLLVQWFAPLASEAPEFLVAILLAFRGRQDAALGTLLSAKVNQWTLLVGSIPLAHFIGGGGWALDLDPRQIEEFFLTASQTVLGIALLLNLRFTTREAILLLSLFLLQFPFPQTQVRLAFSLLYLAIATYLLVRDRRLLRGFLPGAAARSGEAD